MDGKGREDGKRRERREDGSKRGGDGWRNRERIGIEGNGRGRIVRFTCLAFQGFCNQIPSTLIAKCRLFARSGIASLTEGLTGP